MEPEHKKEDIIPGHATIDDFTKDGFKVLVEATKMSNSLPTDRDWDFYKVHDSFKRIMSLEGDKVLRLMNDILHTQQHTANIRNRDLEEKMEMVIEANDDILEKVAIGIDELNGIKRTPQAVEIQAVSARLPVNGSWNQLNKATFSVSSSIDAVKKETTTSEGTMRLLTAKNIIRPQTFFKDKLDNSNNHPWIPRITEKPNSLKPLAIFLEESEHGELYSHPYEFELERFTPPANQLQEVTPLLPKLLEETQLVEISTPEQLEELVEELRKHSEFAVDLEHHSYRTFMGITCLMQISTKDNDYLIDTFALRDKLCLLNEVFTKPTIVKVFHGANHDIEWLQRDLSLYVVNMFDTHQAAKQLEYSGLSLAYLLNRFCNIVPNKHFQLADWRIRPLPEELKTYARMDTHYLIYIYHKLKNELIKKANGKDNILKSVIQQSTQVCKRRFVKFILRDDSHLDFYRKCKRVFDNKQMYALKELYQWRDTLARAEDESTGYVLPNHMLLQIAETLPREMQGILACCNPIPPLVRSNLLELHRIILRARDQSNVKPILKEDTRSRGSTIQFTKINMDSPLNCPHDLSKSPEFRDDLSTLLGDMLKNESSDDKTTVSKANKSTIKLQKVKSMYSMFNTTSDDSSDEDENEAVLKLRNVSFLSPFERYKLVKPYIQAEEEKAAAEKAEKEKNTTEKTEKDEKSQNTSNEDRIAALHAHFVKVSKAVPQKQPSTKGETELADKMMLPKIATPVSLVAMGGSKKRKRMHSEDRSELHPDYKIPHNEVHTPVPTQKGNQEHNKKRRRNRKSKQKQQEMPQNFNQMEEPYLQNRAQAPPVQEPNNTNRNTMNSRQRRSFEWRLKNKQQMEEPHLQNRTPAPPVQEPNNTNRNTMNSRQRRSFEWRLKNKQQKEMKKLAADTNVQVQQHNFTPFDYSSVDFQQFQGGAGGSNKKQAVRTQFKGKNKNKKFNKNSNNRSITFGRPNQ